MAITLRHPWAFAIARLGKDVENRTWKPPSHLVGRRIAIHGGAVPKGAALEEAHDDMLVITRSIATRAYFEKVPIPVLTWLQANDFGNSKLKDWITPGIVATATLKGVVTASDSPWFFGPVGWVLEDVEPLETPVPHRGAQGFWPVSQEALELIPK